MGSHGTHQHTDNPEAKSKPQDQPEGSRLRQPQDHPKSKLRGTPRHRIIDDSVDSQGSESKSESGKNPQCSTHQPCVRQLPVDLAPGGGDLRQREVRNEISDGPAQGSRERFNGATVAQEDREPPMRLLSDGAINLKGRVRSPEISRESNIIHHSDHFLPARILRISAADAFAKGTTFRDLYAASPRI